MLIGESGEASLPLTITTIIVIIAVVPAGMNTGWRLRSALVAGDVGEAGNLSTVE